MGGLGGALRAAVAMLKRDKWAWALYVALGVVVPMLLHAAEPALSLRALLAVASGVGFLSGSMAGPLYLLGFIVLLWSGAQFALWNALLVDPRDGPISEVMYGLVAGLAWSIVYVAAAIILGLIPVFLLGLLVQPLQMAGGGLAVAGAVIGALGQLVIGAWIGSRLWLGGPWMAARGSMNPFAGLMASWRLTKGSARKLFFLYCAVQLVGVLVGGALLIAHSAVIAVNPAGGGALEGLISWSWLLFWAATFAVQVSLAAGIYRTVDVGETAAVFA